MLTKLNNKLVEIGLTDKEAEVYITLMTGGDLTAEEIAKRSKFNRSTTYVHLKALMETGLVTTFKKGKKTFFAAESPKHLERILQNRSERITTQIAEMSILVPELLKIYGSDTERPTVRMFEGKEGLITMRNEILEAKSDMLYVALHYDSMEKIFSTDELVKYSKKRVETGKKSFVIYTKSGEDMKTVEPQIVKRVPVDTFPFGSDLYISGNTVSFASTSQKIFGITITNDDIAKTMKTLFKIAWDGIV